MILDSKFNLKTNAPPGGVGGGGCAGIWASLLTAEGVAARALGTGPTTPNLTGTYQLSTTVKPGKIMVMDTSGNLVMFSSVDISAAMPSLPFLVWTGTNDFDGGYTGKTMVVHGGVRFDTTEFNTASSYTIGAPLIAVSGVLQPKAAFGDHIQIVAWVGPRGLVDGVLDVIKTQGVAGY